MKYRGRRAVAVLGALVLAVTVVLMNPESYETIFTKIENWGAELATAEGDGGDVDGDSVDSTEVGLDGVESGADAGAGAGAGAGADAGAGRKATEVLELLEVKGRAPKKGYSREEFYDGWPMVDGCSLRQRILKRELGETAVLDGCNVVAGEFDEPYTGVHMVLSSKSDVSKIQIDHVVALSDAWQKGAQYMDKTVRYEIATDPLNLLAVDGPANEQKSDGDAATWLPSNKKFRCQYVARQVSVKYKYGLWVTEAEKEAISRVLTGCPNEPTIGI